MTVGLMFAPGFSSVSLTSCLRRVLHPGVYPRWPLVGLAVLAGVVTTAGLLAVITAGFALCF